MHRAPVDDPRSHARSAANAFDAACELVALCRTFCEHCARRVESTTGVWQTDAIRTTLDIDDALMKSLLDRLPGRSKTDAIEYAIETFLATDAVEHLKKLAGTMDIEDVSSGLRALDRTT